MRTLDRYVLREILPPFLIALGIFTFALAINPILEYAKLLLAKGVAVPTVGVLLLTLVPQALSLTIPMALLTGVLMALGRLSTDRESVALLASGISPVRILRPVLAFAVVAAALDMYVLMKVKPDANQTFREITFRHISEHAKTDIKPRVFFERFPGRVLFVGDTTPDGGWTRVFLADTTDPARPTVILAESGELQIDKDIRQVRLVLSNATQYAPGPKDSQVYTTNHHPEALTLKITAEDVFGTGESGYSRGYSEMTFGMLRAEADRKRSLGLSPHNEVMHMQQMFSFPAACIVFALLAVPLGLNTRKEGRLAALAVGLGVIALYYTLMQVAESWVKGEATQSGAGLPAMWARWIPNVVLALVGLLALWRNTRTSLPTIPSLWPRRTTAAASAARPRSPRASRQVLVIRLPPLAFPRILDRYISGHYLRIAALAFVALLTLYYIGETVDLAEKVFKGQATGRALLHYLWRATPQFIALVIPLATLMAVLGTMGVLTRSGELMVMRATGVSLYRAAAPLVVFAIAWAAILFLMEDRVLGESRPQAAAMRDAIRGIRSDTIDVAGHRWMVGEDGRIYQYASLEPAGRLNANRPTLNHLSIFESEDAPYRLKTQTYARRATFEGGAWRAHTGWIQTLTAPSASRSDFDRMTLAIPGVEDFQRTQIDASRMSFRELREYVQRLGASGFNVAEQRVDLHRKIAFPAVTIVLTLLAIPFGVTTGKKGALYGIGLAAVLAGGYFLLLTVFLAMGAAGVLPAMLAAWAPNLIFGSAALVMILTVRT